MWKQAQHHQATSRPRAHQFLKTTYVKPLVKITCLVLIVVLVIGFSLHKKHKKHTLNTQVTVYCLWLQSATGANLNTCFSVHNCWFVGALHMIVVFALIFGLLAVAAAYL